MMFTLPMLVNSSTRCGLEVVCADLGYGLVTFPTGQRAQFVIPPAVEASQVSITIRLPSRQTRTLGQYHEDGFFDKLLEETSGISAHDRELLELRAAGRYADFFKQAVLHKKNIVVSGATGSGKTTFMKSLVHHIPADERLVTIEDARELFIEQGTVVNVYVAKDVDFSVVVASF